MISVPVYELVFRLSYRCRLIAFAEAKRAQSLVEAPLSCYNHLLATAASPELGAVSSSMAPFTQHNKQLRYRTRPTVVYNRIIAGPPSRGTWTSNPSVVG
jgi:hypothetical protein